MQGDRRVWEASQPVEGEKWNDTDRLSVNGHVWNIQTRIRLIRIWLVYYSTQLLEWFKNFEQQIFSNISH